MYASSPGRSRAAVDCLSLCGAMRRARSVGHPQGGVRPPSHCRGRQQGAAGSCGHLLLQRDPVLRQGPAGCTRGIDRRRPAEPLRTSCVAVDASAGYCLTGPLGERLAGGTTAIARWDLPDFPTDAVRRSHEQQAVATLPSAASGEHCCEFQHCATSTLREVSPSSHTSRCTNRSCSREPRAPSTLTARTSLSSGSSKCGACTRGCSFSCHPASTRRRQPQLVPRHPPCCCLRPTRDVCVLSHA